MSNSSLTKDQTSSTKKVTTPKNTPKKSHFFKWFWGLWISGIIGVFVFFWALSNGWLNWLIPMPNPDELENPQISIASSIYSYDNKSLGKFFKEKSIPVGYNDLSDNLIDALVATEDERFTEHSGIDLEGLGRAIASFGTSGGGSTITQQLAKMLFTQEEARKKKNTNRILQKLGEWVMAVQLEKRFTKEEIITMYFNKFQFEHNVVGIKLVSKTYFNKLPRDLTKDEAALLVGMFKTPSKFNPRRNVKNAIERRNVVLGQMLKNNKISQIEYDNLILKPIKITYSPVKTTENANATYFKDFLKDEVHELLAKNGITKLNGQAYDVDVDGLRIYTTIDTRMQANAENACKQHLTKLQSIFNTEKRGNPLFPFRGKTIGPKTVDTLMYQAIRRTQRYKSMREAGKTEAEIVNYFKTEKVLVNKFTWDKDSGKEEYMTPWDSIRYYKSIVQVGMMSMEPQTGFVKAWVGGIDYNYFQFDHVKKGKRQVGSTFKPFVYVTAISEKHLSPCHAISNATYKNGSWRLPGSGGDVSLRVALAKSLNPVTARLIEMTTPKPVIDLCKDLGITTELPNNPTIALGSSEISIYEMVGAYSTFVNNGIYTRPTVVWRIEDKDGQVLYEYTPETKEVFSAEVAYTMLKIMQGAVDIKGGTANRLRGLGIKNTVACKTGTTNSNSDGWFMGMVPNLVTGVWVGWEDRAAHFLSTAMGQGASMAMPIWAHYMKANYANKDLGISTEKFEEPILEEGEEPKIDYNCSGVESYKSFGELGYIESMYGEKPTDSNSSSNSSENNNNNGADSLDVNEQMQIEGDLPDNVID